MELWNDGIVGLLKDNIHFQFYRSAFGGPLAQHSIILSEPASRPEGGLHEPEANIPSFQHSNRTTQRRSTC